MGRYREALLLGAELGVRGVVAVPGRVSPLIGPPRRGDRAAARRERRGAPRRRGGDGGVRLPRAAPADADPDRRRARPVRGRIRRPAAPRRLRRRERGVPRRGPRRGAPPPRTAPRAGAPLRRQRDALGRRPHRPRHRGLRDDLPDARRDRVRRQRASWKSSRRRRFPTSRHRWTRSHRPALRNCHWSTPGGRARLRADARLSTIERLSTITQAGDHGGIVSVEPQDSRAPRSRRSTAQGRAARPAGGRGAPQRDRRRPLRAR